MCSSKNNSQNRAPKAVCGSNNKGKSKRQNKTDSTKAIAKIPELLVQWLQETEVICLHLTIKIMMAIATIIEEYKRLTLMVFVIDVANRFVNIALMRFRKT